MRHLLETLLLDTLFVCQSVAHLMQKVKKGVVAILKSEHTWCLVIYMVALLLLIGAGI